MVVKDILRYKQKGDRTEHWVKERNKSKKVEYSNLLSIPITTWGSSLGSVTTNTATQIQVLQSQQAQQQYQQYYQPVQYSNGFGNFVSSGL